MKENLTYNETVEYLFHASLDTITIAASPGHTATRFLIPHGLCKIYTGKLNRFLQIKLDLTSSITEYFVFISDPAVSTSFQSSLTMGDKMRLKTSGKPDIGKYEEFKVQLKETSIETGERIFFLQCSWLYI